MTHRRTLQITSLLAILLFSLHWADEIARGIESGTTKAAAGLLILAIWLYGGTALIERRSGLVILLLAALLASVVPALHMQGAGLVGGRIADTSGRLFWVWTLVGLGVTGVVSLVLSAQQLWSLRRSAADRGEIA